ncbi:hypothetical protein R1flu_007797 [Riccia fluitans]|uniref:Uncharacterized protein n=1 Tax=Riccia fluitans TaxID=41844 RepID=A0ABD1YZW2_9MARC
MTRVACTERSAKDENGQGSATRATAVDEGGNCHTKRRTGRKLRSINSKNVKLAESHVANAEHAKVERRSSGSRRAGNESKAGE